MRIDQWLWAVRLFKTRTLAVEAIRGGRVKIEGKAIKASREIRGGEVITVSGPERIRIVAVLGVPKSRVGAKLVGEYLEDRSPQPSGEVHPGRRERGAGRPTKRERRVLDDFLEGDGL
ncbi:MAG TPA: RNA-binding S4 domain-containing protein [Chthoniobacteraceae bacterium]|nr:RNA-binding S4 domain-containing protein [Chthoniobacteraceae bacterium]